jgi:DNA-binding transcriptional ArsR family regulator
VAYQAVLEALADPTRREVFERLRSGPLPVVEIARGLPVSRPAVSQHLRVLKDAGLVSDRAEGNRRLYQVETPALAELRRYLEGFWDEVLEAYRRAAEAPIEGEEPPSGAKPAGRRKRGATKRSRNGKRGGR